MTRSDSSVGRDAGKAFEPPNPPPVDDVLSPADRDLLAIASIDVHWERFWPARYGPDSDPDEALAAVRRLIAVIRSSPLSGCDPQLSLYARMMAGLSHLERFGLTEHRRDLDSGIDKLAASLPDLPLDTPRRELAAAELANAYRLRAILDDDATSLDLSIVAGDQAIEAFDDREPVTWLLLHQNQALAHEDRWRRARDVADLDRAIACWLILLRAVSPERQVGWEAAHCGELLRERGQLRRDPADVAGAIVLLDRATRGTPQDPDAWLRWYELGRAHHVQWRLTNLPGSLEAAAVCLDNTLRLGVPADGQPLLVHVQRLLVAFDSLGPGGQPARTPPRTGTRARPPAAGIKELLVKARAALGRGRHHDPHQRAVLVLLLAWTDSWADGWADRSADRSADGSAARTADGSAGGPAETTASGQNVATFDGVRWRALLARAARLCELPVPRPTGGPRHCRRWGDAGLGRSRSRRGPRPEPTGKPPIVP